jgi:serine/threonine-protein kinase
MNQSPQTGASRPADARTASISDETVLASTVVRQPLLEAKAETEVPTQVGLAEVPATVAGYEILGVLGRGAMGVVYKARQRGLQRLVALKMILSGEHAGQDERSRFQAEAEAVARLRHANIVQIYEVGAEQGRPFFSLEFVEGSTLARKTNGTPLPPTEAAHMLLMLALAMDHAHTNNVIHRDLKPGNVLLTPDGAPKIGDFGLAKRIDVEAGQTRPGTVLGTLSYMAPEQAEGRLHEVGPLSDQYSLGAILYELLTGRPPFKAATLLDTLHQVRTLEPVAPMEFQPGVPRDLETICLKCLQKDPAQRYASCGALAEDLRCYLAGEAILARPSRATERLGRWCKRNPGVAGLSAAVAVLLVLGIVGLSVFSFMLKRERDQTELARLEAKQNEEAARQQEALAQEKKKEAERNAARARENETRARDTAQLTVQEMINLAGRLHKRLAGQNSPEIRRLREEVLTLLRESLVRMSQKVQDLGISNFGQAFSYAALGDLLAKLGAQQEALRAWQQAYDLVKRVADAEPNNDVARGNLGVMALRLGRVALDLEGDPETARARETRARDLHREILTHPRSGHYKEIDGKRLMAFDDVELGRIHLVLGQPAEARPYFEEARKYRQEWSAAEPRNKTASSYLTEAELWLGIVCSHLGDTQGARGHFEEAARLTAGLAGKFPDDFSFRRDLGTIHGAWGDTLLRVGKEEAAEKAYLEALKNVRLALDHDPEDLEAQQELAQAHARLGTVSARRHRAADAEKHYQEALKLETALLQLEPANVTRQAARVLALARCGRHAEAAAEAAKVQPRVARSPELLLQLARCYATCAAADTARKAEYVKLALEALRAATNRDYKDAVALQSDIELEPIRGEAAFKAIVEKVKRRQERQARFLVPTLRVGTHARLLCVQRGRHSA